MPSWHERPEGGPPPWPEFLVALGLELAVVVCLLVVIAGLAERL